MFEFILVFVTWVGLGGPCGPVSIAEADGAVAVSPTSPHSEQGEAR